MYGKKFLGIERTTFLIDESGVIINIYRKASPTNNVYEILNEL
jgi:peroxiredoxin Q/BCP